jgi:hypothetical protein
MWKASDPQLWLMALSLLPLVPAVIALLVPTSRLLAFAAAVPNLLVFLGGLVALVLLVSGIKPYYASQTVGVVMLLSIGALNFAILHGQYAAARAPRAAEHGR